MVVDPTVMPTNVYGLDCGNLVSDADIQSLYGTALLRRENDVLVEADLVQDRALVCEWGVPSYEGNASPFISVAVAPYGRTAFDALIASHAPQEPGDAAVSVPGIGDAAWAGCFIYGPDAATTTCSWAIAAGDAWIVVKWGSEPASEVAVTRIDDSMASAAPLADSVSAGLLRTIVAAVGATTPESLPEPAATPPACSALVDWTAFASEFGIAAPSFPTYPPYLDEFGAVVQAGISDRAAERRGALDCYAQFSDGSEIHINILPGAGWLGAEGAIGSADVGYLFQRWEGWDAESCHPSAGGERCQLSGFAGGNAISVNAYGASRELMTARLHELLAAR